jgi:hypothetical protein
VRLSRLLRQDMAILATDPDVQAVTLALSCWGAAVATGLAVLRAVEFFEGRRRLSTNYSFSSAPDGSNVIFLENPTGTPVMIQFWMLMKVRKFWWYAFDAEEIEYGEGYSMLTVPAHDRVPLTLSNGWPEVEVKGKRDTLYLVAHIVGRARPLWLKVCP